MLSALRHWVVLLCFVASLPARALDRNAFTFTHSDLRVKIDPHQHGLSVQGSLEVRNTSKLPQHEVVLQISSSLRWLSILNDGQPVEWLAQNYTSDIDHTGALSEAIVKLDKPLAPGEQVLLNVRYSGTVTKDTTRLERIGTPEDVARRSDWDEISESFTALRGAGYVVWYPVSMNAASLSQGAELFEILRDWRARESTSDMRVQLAAVTPTEGEDPKFAFVSNATSGKPAASAVFEFHGIDPVIVMLNDHAETTNRPQVDAYYTAAHTSFARDYVAAAESVIPPLQEWFGAPRRRVVLVELTDPNALPYDAGSYYFVPMRKVEHSAAEVAMARPVANAMLNVARPWMREGLAGFAQALVRERQGGRRAALSYLGQFRSALAVAEAQATSAAETKQGEAEAAPQPLIKTADEVYLHSKAAYVWWMLRDMVGERALQAALGAYRAQEDRDTGYVQHLIQKQAPGRRDLETFFDDWVYRDRGLPQLRVDSAYVRKTLGEQTVTAVTVENLGNAWCELPVTVRAGKAENSLRLAVPAKGKAIIRVPFEGVPTEAEVNDGSVPEAERRDNVIPVTTSPPAQR